MQYDTEKINRKRKRADDDEYIKPLCCKRSGQACEEKKNIAFFPLLFSVVNEYMTYIQYLYFSPFNHEFLSHVLPRPSTSF